MEETLAESWENLVNDLRDELAEFVRDFPQATNIRSVVERFLRLDVPGDDMELFERRTLAGALHNSMENFRLAVQLLRHR